MQMLSHIWTKRILKIDASDVMMRKLPVKFFIKEVVWRFALKSKVVEV